MRRAAIVTGLFAVLMGSGCGNPEEQVNKAIKRSGLPAKAREQTKPQTVGPVRPTPVPPRRFVCRFLSDEQASRAFGQPVRGDVGDGPNHCVFEIEGIGNPFTLRVDDNTENFYELTAAHGAEMVDVGDRAVWLNGTLHVISGRKRVTVEMAEGPGDRADRLRNAQAVARAVVQNL